MIKFIKQFFSNKTTDLPTLPIKEIRSLTKMEIEYVINEFSNKQFEKMNKIENGDSLEKGEELEFLKLITTRIINNLKYKIPFLEIELAYLNGVLRNKKIMHIKFRLFHQAKETETVDLTDLVVNQGFSFVPSVGYLKIG